MNRLTDRVALITGASGGIGQAVAKAMAAEGARIAVHYRGSKDTADEIVAAIRDNGGQAAAFRADVSKLADVQAMREAIEASLGPIDILVSNAGVSSVRPFLECTPEEWDQIVATNLYGFYNCVYAIAPGMVERRFGRIIATGSIGAEAAPAGEVTFVLSAGTKGGIMAMIRPLATEFGPHNVTVNCVSPGTTLSGMVSDEPSEIRGRIMASVRLVPLGRHGTPGDIANAMVFLASDDASFITGQTLSVNGGFYYR